jgi:hypothetical protein
MFAPVRTGLRTPRPLRLYIANPRVSTFGSFHEEDEECFAWDDGVLRATDRPSGSCTGSVTAYRAATGLHTRKRTIAICCRTEGATATSTSAAQR